MVDAKCTFINGKKQDSASNSEDLNEDESLLRQPLRTSCAGFKEAKRAYENGTDEVRQLLMQECSLIYECNVCRNMFRSLANFITHKRHYCTTATADNFHSFLGRNGSMVIQTVERSGPFLVKSRSTGSSPISNTKSPNRDLNKVIEQLKRVEVSSGCSRKKWTCNTELCLPVGNVADPILELERVSSTTNAVYQTLKTKNNVDSIKTELDEVHNLLSDKNILLGPDGKAVMPFNSSTVSSGKTSEENNCEITQLSSGISCEVCKMSFQTEKTLKMHVEKNHTSTTYVFQCPSCSMTFLQPAAVIRHLANEHKKPLRRIRKMRDAILKKRIQIGDVQVKGMGREVKRLMITNREYLDGSNSADQQNGRAVSSCSYCLKMFERRAALATHLINCVARKTTLRNTESSNNTNVANEIDLGVTTENQTSNQVLVHNNKNDKTQNNQKEEEPEVKGKIIEEPQEELNSVNNSSNINELFENLENQTFGNGLHTVCLENIEMLEEPKKENCEEQEDTKKEDIKTNCYTDQTNDKKAEENDATSIDKSSKKEKSKRFRIVSASKQLTCRCKICNKQFNALSNLRRHISMFHYRSKRFGCNLCDYRAFRRYDIVNHLTFVHKITGERETMAVEYVTVHEIKYSKDDVEGDIVVVNDEAIVSELCRRKQKEPQTTVSEIAINRCEKREESKSVHMQPSTDALRALKINLDELKDKTHIKVVGRRFKKALETQAEDKKRPIRNRIKTVNQDFVYDLLSIKDEPKQTSRLSCKRSNAAFIDQNNFRELDLALPPVKITPYRLRTEPLMPADKSSVKGVAANVCRNVIHESLAAPSTLPELPAERPQMRSRLLLSSRSDSNTIPIIESSELEAAGLKSTFFDDSFLEKFAKKSNPSFKMKPLLAMQHSPLNSILQKFDASQQKNTKSMESKIYDKSLDSSSPPNYSICLLKSITQPKLKEKDVTPNGKQIDKLPSPPATPKKRITLMERLAENRAKRRDSIIRNALEN